MEALEDRTVPTIVNVSALSDITEGGSYGIVQFSRDNTSGSLSLSFTITGTATNGTDYTLSTSSPVSFASGVATANVNVTPIDDAFVEGTETIIFTIDSGSYTIGTGSATMNLYDNDLSPPPPPPPPPATVVSVASLGNITEGGSSGTFELTRNNTSGTLSVPFSLSGSATSLIDYNVSPTAPATFASGSATADITISPVDDSNVEGTEGINITLGIGAYTIGTGSATMSLFDNDNTQVSIASDGDVTEGDTGTFTITRTGSTASSLVVSYSMSGTATSGTDYTAPSGSATIAAGDSSVDVSIPTLADNLVEGNETVIATVADGGSSYSANGSSATATMTIDDDPPELIIDAVNVTEGESGDVVLNRSGGDTSSSLTVSYTVDSSSTATSGTDYTTLSGTVTFAASSDTASITISAATDTIYDPGETVVLVFSPSSNYLLVDNAPSEYVVNTIVDDPGSTETTLDDASLNLTNTDTDQLVPVEVTIVNNASTAPGLYTWTYTITNPTSNTSSWTSFSVPIQNMDSDVGTIISPSGWSGTINTDSIDWTTTGSGLAPDGSSISFSFATAPRDTAAATVLTSDGTINATNTAAPAPGAQKVPFTWNTYTGADSKTYDYPKWNIDVSDTNKRTLNIAQGNLTYPATPAVTKVIFNIYEPAAVAGTWQATPTLIYQSNTAPTYVVGSGWLVTATDTTTPTKRFNEGESIKITWQITTTSSLGVKKDSTFDLFITVNYH